MRVGLVNVANRGVMAVLALAILALATGFAARTAFAQTYAPGYPVCLHVYGRVAYIECRYTSIEQCKATASGRAADCEINPYAANGGVFAPPLRHHRRGY